MKLGNCVFSRFISPEASLWGYHHSESVLEVFTLRTKQQSLKKKWVCRQSRLYCFGRRFKQISLFLRSTDAVEQVFLLHSIIYLGRRLEVLQKCGEEGLDRYNCRRTFSSGE